MAMETDTSSTSSISYDEPPALFTANSMESIQIVNELPPIYTRLQQYDDDRFFLTMGEQSEPEIYYHKWAFSTDWAANFVVAWNCISAHQRREISKLMDMFTEPAYHCVAAVNDFYHQLKDILKGVRGHDILVRVIYMRYRQSQLEDLVETGKLEPMSNRPYRQYLANRCRSLIANYTCEDGFWDVYKPVNHNQLFYGPSTFDIDINGGGYSRKRYFFPALDYRSTVWLDDMPCWFLQEWLDREYWYYNNYFESGELSEFVRTRITQEFFNCRTAEDVREMVYGYRQHSPTVFDGFTKLYMTRANLKHTLSWSKRITREIVKDYRRTDKWHFDKFKDILKPKGYLRYNNLAQHVVNMQYQNEEGSSSSPGHAVAQSIITDLQLPSLAQAAGSVLRDSFMDNISKHFGHLIKQMKIINWTLLGVSICQIVLFIVDFILNGWSAVRFANMGLSMFVLATEIMLAFKLNSFDTKALMDFVTDMVSSIMKPSNQASAPAAAEYESDTTEIGAIAEPLIREAINRLNPNVGSSTATQPPKKTLADFMKSGFNFDTTEPERMPVECVIKPYAKRTKAKKNETGFNAFWKGEDPPPEEKEDQALSVETCLRIICGVLALGTSVVGLKYSGVCDFQKRYVNSSRFADALTKNVTGINELVGTISQEAFGYSISGYDAVVANIKKSLAYLASFHQRPNIDFSSNYPLFYQYRDAISEAELTVKDLSKPYSQLPTSVSTMITSLNTAISVARSHFAEVQRAVAVEKPRTETIIVHLVGKPAAGKTWLVNNFLIPELAGRYGWNTEPYSINFADQVYWKPYKGQEIALYDEFLAKREEDPILSYINLIGSTGHINLPGAELRDKVQACNFKIMFLISNVHYHNLRNKLTAEAEAAVYSRLIRYEVINKDQKDGQSREQVPRAKDYSNMEFRRYKAPVKTGQPMGQVTPGESDVLTLREMMDDLINRIDTKKAEFDKMIAERNLHIEAGTSAAKEPQADYVQHHVYLLHGQPGTGKTELARRLARRLARLMRLDVHDITTQSFSNIRPYSSRAIFVVHDRLTDEQAYSNFYDSLPAPSIILLTANIELGHTGMLRTYATTPPTNGLGLLSKVGSFTANMWHSWKYRCTTVKQYRAVNPEPGFIRRIGIPGPLLHQGVRSFRSYDTGATIECIPGFRALFTGKVGDDMVVSQEVTENNLIDAIFEKYRQYIEGHSEIKITKATEDFTVPVGDVMIKAQSHDQLFAMCSDVKSVINAWFNARQGIMPYVHIDASVINNTFSYKPEMFLLMKSKDISEIITMAKRTYATLRNGNEKFTVSIDAGDFKAYANQGEIKWYSTSSECILQWYEWSKSADNKFIEVTTKVADGPGKIEIKDKRTYPTDQIIYGLVNGFHSVPAVERSICEYLMSCSQEILERREHRIIVEQARVAKVSLQGVAERKEEFEVKWNAFINLSPWYKMMVVFCGITVAVSAVLMIVGLIKWAIEKSPPRLQASATSVDCHMEHAKWQIVHIDYQCVDERDRGYRAVARVKYNGYDGDQSAKEDWRDMKMADIFDGLIDTDFHERFKDDAEAWLSGITYVHQQAVYTSDGKRKGQHKGRSAKATKYIRPEKQDPQAFFNSNFNDPSVVAIRQKVLRNQCKIFTHGGASTFALRVRGRFILTPAHLWNEVGEMGIIRVPENDKEMQYQVQCVHIDRDYDTAVVYSFDKTLNECADIVPYFHKREMSSKVLQGVLVKIDSPKAISDPEWFKKNVVSMPGFIQRVCSPASRDGDERLHMYTYEKYMGLSIPTVAGDCGQPYFCTQKEFGSNILLGLHVSRSTQGNSTDLSALDVDMLNHWLSICQKKVAKGVLPKTSSAGVEQQYQPTVMDSLIGDMKIYRFEAPDKHPMMKTYANMKIDEDYAKWMRELKEADEEEYKAITWSPENPSANILYIGYDPKHTPSYLGKPSHVRTPWSDDLTIPNLVLPSVVSYKQLSAERQSQLPRINKRPSVVLEQVSFYNDPYTWGALQEKLLEHAATLLQQKYSDWYRGPHRILTELESINGLCINPREPWFDGLQGLDLSSSAGDFPKRYFNITRKGELFRPLPQATGERQLYTWDNSEAAKAVVLRKRIIEQLAQRGDHLITPMQDNLKRELVKPGKARCFQSLTIEETVFIRKYTGTIQAAVMKNHTRAYCQVGIDPYVEFHALRNRFAKTSLVGEAGDFSRFDKHLLGPMIYRALMIYWQVWKENQPAHTDCTNYENVWKVIANLTINSVSVADGLVYMKIRGNPSGNPLTSILNSTVNELYEYMFVIYQVQQLHIRNSLDSSKLSPEMRTICKNKSASKIIDLAISELDGATYGDDCVWVFRPRWQSILGFEAKKQFLQSQLGITYDTPEKDGRTYESRSLQEMSFLSRTFTLDNGVVFPRLKTMTLHSYFHWTSSMAPLQIEQLMRDAFTEAALYPLDEYTQWVECFRKVDAWFKERGVHLNFTPSSWDVARTRAQNMILHGRDVSYSYPENMKEELYTNPSLSVHREELVCDYIENIREDNFKTETRLSVLQCEYFDMSYEIICAEIDRMMRDVPMDTLSLKEIKSYRPYPAFVETLTDQYYSVVFDLVDTDIVNFRTLQSDTMKIINIAVSSDIRLDLLKATYVSRRIQPNQPLVRAAQIMLHVVPKVESRRWNTKKNLVEGLGDLLRSTFVQQASGTSEVPNITQSSTGNATDNAIILPVQDNHVAPLALEASLWHYDIKELAHREMETLNSPIEIPVDTPAGSIVDIVSLGELGVMSPAMRIWAQVNSVTNATMWIKYEFVTAATIINSLRVGIARERKATYTPQELQLIKWYDINPQDNTISFPLRLAATDETEKIPNRYTFSETIASGTMIPTIVLMTRTVIQNSYQNTAVSVNLKRFAWFQNETRGPSAFRATAEDLATGFPATTALTRSRGGQLLSTLLNLEPGRPFNIVCDGAMSMRANQKFGRTMDIFDPIWHRTSVNRNLPNAASRARDAIVATCDVQIELQLGAQTNDPIDIGPNWNERINNPDKTWPSLGWRRTLTYNSTAPAIMLPFYDNDPITFDNEQHATWMAAVSNWTSQTYGEISQDTLITRFWQTQLPAPRSFWVFWSANGSPIPGIDFSFNQEYSLWSSDIPTDVYEEFMTVWKTTLEAQGWDIVETTLELTGLDIISYPLISDAYTPWGVSFTDASGWQGGYIASYKQTTYVDVLSVGRRPRFVDSWPEGAKRLIKLYHPEIGTHYVFAMLRNKPDAVTTADTVHNTMINHNSFTGTVSNPRTSGNLNNNIMIVGTFECHTLVNNMPNMEQLITRVADISVQGDITLAPVQSRIVFSPTIPSTLTTTVAESLAGTEMNDTLFHTSFHQWLLNQGVTEEQVVRFSLSNIANTYIFATVTYDMTHRYFYIVNSPTSNEDRYRAYPKLTYEQVTLFNLQVLSTNITTGQATDTRTWVSRVVPDTSRKVFNGNFIGSSGISVANRIRKTMQVQAEEVAMAASGAMSGIGQALLQLLFGNKRFQQLSDFQKQQFENDLALLKAKYSGEQDLIQKRADVNSLQSGVAQHSAAQSSLPLSAITPAGKSYLQEFVKAQDSDSAPTDASSAPTVEVSDVGVLDKPESCLTQTGDHNNVNLPLGSVPPPEGASSPSQPSRVYHNTSLKGKTQDSGIMKSSQAKRPFVTPAINSPTSNTTTAGASTGYDPFKGKSVPAL